MNGEESKYRGEITNLPYVDLTGITTAQELEQITSIVNCGAVLVPQSLSGAAARISMTNVGAVLPIPEGRKVTVQSGLVQLSGTALANSAGDPGDILVIVGQAVITGAVPQVDYELMVVGQLLAPKESEAAISSAITKIVGTVHYYRGEKLRLYLEDASLDQEFFELLAEPHAMAVLSSVTLESDVSKEVLRKKVTDIILMGEMSVPQHLKSQVQALATQQMGSITVYKGEGANGVAMQNI